MDENEVQLKQSVYVYALYPPLSLIVLLLILCYITLALYLVSYHHVGKNSKKVPGIISCLIKITFRGSFAKKNTNKGEKELRLFGYLVPVGLVNSLGLIAMIVWVGVAAAFWIVLIGKERGTFQPENCLYNESDCSPIMFNKVSLDYVRALGAAGGLLVLSTVILQGQTILIMWMMKKSRTLNLKARRCWKSSLIIVVCVPLLMEVVFFVGATVCALYFNLYDSLQHWIQFGSFVIAVFQSTYFSSITLYFTWSRRTAVTRGGDIEEGVELLGDMLQNGETVTTRVTDEGPFITENNDKLTSPLLS